MCKLSGLFTGPFIHFFFSLFFSLFLLSTRVMRKTLDQISFFSCLFIFSLKHWDLPGAIKVMSTVSLEMLYAFSVYVNILIMRRYAANKLMKKNSALSSWYICPEVVCRNFFCFRRLWHIACTAMWELLFFFLFS